MNTSPLASGSWPQSIFNFFVYKPVLVLAAFAVCLTSAHAQTVLGRFGVEDAQSVKLGETDLFPALRLDFTSNDNAFRQPDQAAIDTTGVTVSPDLVWVADRRLLSLVGRYQGEYHASSEDALSFDDHTFSIRADADLSIRKRLSGNLSLGFGHQGFGTELTRGESTEGAELVEFTDFLAEGRYRYGAEGARGNIVVGARARSLGYTSRSDVTDGRSFTQFQPFAQFSLRISGGNTRVLSEIRIASFSFDDSRRDRNDLSLLAGVQLATRAKTGGSFSFGVVQSDSASDDVSDETRFIYEAGLFWEPTTFSKFDLQGSREIDNEGSSLVANNADSSTLDRLSLNWNHNWSSRLSHLAVLSVSNRSGECPERDRSIVTAQFELNLQIRRWLSAGFNADVETQQVDDCMSFDNGLDDLDYDNTQLGIHLRATL